MASKSKKKNIPKSIKDMSKEMLQETLEKKKVQNAKAQKIVEMLCELKIDEQWFLDNLQHINQSHFEDVTIERSILKICGYPLCDNELKNILTQQYHISTKYNKVFDITKRKNFCSSLCYKAAMFVKNQLFTSPLWFRDQEVIPTYTLMKSANFDKKENIVLPQTNSNHEDNFTINVNLSNLNINDPLLLDESQALIDKIPSTSNYARHDDETYMKKEGKAKEPVSIKVKNSSDTFNIKIKENINAFEKVEPDNKLNNASNSKVLSKDNNLENNVLSNENKTNFTFNKTNNNENQKLKEKNFMTGIEKVETTVFEWFTLDTFFFLYSEKKLKELFHDNYDNLKEILNSKLSKTTSTEKIEKIIKLYGLLETDVFNSESMKTNLKPLPDYSALQEEGKKINIKVKAFYKGEFQMDKSLKNDDDNQNKGDLTEEASNVYLPLIDSQSQNTLRQNILLSKLNKILPEIFRLFSTKYTLPMNEIKKMITTFKLSPHNITFKPVEWNLIGIILLKLFSIKDKYIYTIFSLDSSRIQLNILLQSFYLETDYLETLISKLTNTNNVLESLK